MAMSNETDEHLENLRHGLANEPTDGLVNALIKAYSEISSAVFDKKNPHFNSKYASLESVIKAVKPALLKHGVLYRQVSRFHENGVSVETIFHGHSASLGTGEIFLPADKKTPQGFGSALTYARRYSLALACGIGSDEDDDANIATKETKSKPVPKKTVSVETTTKKETQSKTNDWKTDGTIDGAKFHRDGFKYTLDLLKDKQEVSDHWKSWKESEDGLFMKEMFEDIYAEIFELCKDKMKGFEQGGKDD
jgi:hypothetical protein